MSLREAAADDSCAKAREPGAAAAAGGGGHKGRPPLGEIYLRLGGADTGERVW